MSNASSVYTLLYNKGGNWSFKSKTSRLERKYDDRESEQVQVYTCKSECVCENVFVTYLLKQTADLITFHYRYVFTVYLYIQIQTKFQS